MTRKVEKMFLEAYGLYSDKIYRHCFFRIFSKERAEEIMQDTFLKTWQYLSEGKEVKNIQAFLYQVATNLIIDNVRKKKEESLNMLMEDEKIKEPSYEGNMHIEDQVTLNEIKKVLKQLSKEEEEVLVLRYIDDLDPREIAEIIGITSNNVSVRIHRALETLKKLVNNGNDEGDWMKKNSPKKEN